MHPSFVALLTVGPAFRLIVCLHVAAALVIEVIVVVPRLWTARVVLGEDEDEIVSPKLDASLWVSDNVLDLLELFLVEFVGTIVTLIADMPIFIIRLEFLIIDHLTSVQSNWNHLSSCSQVVEQV